MSGIRIESFTRGSSVRNVAKGWVLVCLLAAGSAAWSQEGPAASAAAAAGAPVAAGASVLAIAAGSATASRRWRWQFRCSIRARQPCARWWWDRNRRSAKTLSRRNRYPSGSRRRVGETVLLPRLSFQVRPWWPHIPLDPGKRHPPEERPECFGLSRRSSDRWSKCRC